MISCFKLSESNEKLRKEVSLLIKSGYSHCGQSWNADNGLFYKSQENYISKKTQQIINGNYHFIAIVDKDNYRIYSKDYSLETLTKTLVSEGYNAAGIVQFDDFRKFAESNRFQV